MEGKKFILIYAAVFLFSGYMLYAQESSSVSPGYYLDKSTGEPVFKQRLAWDEEEYALYYEIVIQIFSGRQFSEYYSEITENTFIEISMPPGRYRYSVTPYDLLRRRGDSSEWEEFFVNTAYQPEITKIAPDFFYMDQRQERVLIISGKNIFSDSVIFLRNNSNNLIPINQVVTNNSSVKLTFDDDELVPGIYELYIKNPGGLDTFWGGFFVGYHKKFETFLKLGFNPVIPMSGELQEIFKSYLYPSGVTFRLESLSSERSSFKAGLEFVISLYYLNFDDSLKPKSAEGTFKFTSDAYVSLVDFNVNVSLQRRFNHLRNAITFFFGFGLTAYEGSSFDVSHHTDYDTDKEYNRNELNGSMNLGISGLFFVYGILYIETGVEYTYYLTGASGVIKPRIGLVLKF